VREVRQSDGYYESEITMTTPAAPEGSGERPKTPEFYIRVKLPNPAGFASCPSGDTEYSEAYQGAIFAAKPQGFEVRYPRGNQRWATDSEGFTLVPLFLTDEKLATAKLIERIHDLERRIETAKSYMKRVQECL
jgi:hypothetical protein